MPGKKKMTSAQILANYFNLLVFVQAFEWYSPYFLLKDRYEKKVLGAASKLFSFTYIMDGALLSRHTRTNLEANTVAFKVISDRKIFKTGSDLIRYWTMYCFCLLFLITKVNP